jgi:hypothetical protein
MSVIFPSMIVQMGCLVRPFFATHFKSSSLQFIPFVWVGLNTFFVYIMAAADVFDSILGWFYWFGNFLEHA